MLAIPQLPSTFSADVAAITGATYFLRQACRHSDHVLVWLSGTLRAQLATCRHTSGKRRLPCQQSRNKLLLLRRLQQHYRLSDGSHLQARLEHPPAAAPATRAASAQMRHRRVSAAGLACARRAGPGPRSCRRCCPPAPATWVRSPAKHAAPVHSCTWDLWPAMLLTCTCPSGRSMKLSQQGPAWLGCPMWAPERH